MTDRIQCLGQTQKGEQCKRMVSPEVGKCSQHQQQPDSTREYGSWQQIAKHLDPSQFSAFLRTSKGHQATLTTDEMWQHPKVQQILATSDLVAAYETRWKPLIERVIHQLHDQPPISNSDLCGMIGEVGDVRLFDQLRAPESVFDWRDVASGAISKNRLNMLRRADQELPDRISHEYLIGQTVIANNRDAFNQFLVCPHMTNNLLQVIALNATTEGNHKMIDWLKDRLTPKIMTQVLMEAVKQGNQEIIKMLIPYKDQMNLNKALRDARPEILDLYK